MSYEAVNSICITHLSRLTDGIIEKVTTQYLTERHALSKALFESFFIKSRVRNTVKHLWWDCFWKIAIFTKAFHHKHLTMFQKTFLIWELWTHFSLILNKIWCFPISFLELTYRQLSMDLLTFTKQILRKSLSVQYYQNVFANWHDRADLESSLWLEDI